MGRVIRLFEGSGGEVMYVGRFEVDPNRPYEQTQAPETGGGPMRTVIHFRLRPVGEFYVDGSLRTVERNQAALRTPYRRADQTPRTQTREPFEVDPDVVDRALEIHAKLQNGLADAAEAAGYAVRSPGPWGSAVRCGLVARRLRG